MKAFTDGSSRGNPGPGGWGAILISGERVKEIGGREDSTTNNRMEMRAVIEAIKTADGRDIEIYTDSAYVVNGATKWIKGWKFNGWKTKDKKDVLNKDLWIELDEVLSKNSLVSFNLVPGHSGVALNERADVIATSFADKKPDTLFLGNLSDYPISMSLDANSTSSVKRGRTGKAHSYVSKVDGVIFVDKTWSECETRVKGKRAVRFKKALSPEEESAIIEEFKRVS